MRSNDAVRIPQRNRKKWGLLLLSLLPAIAAPMPPQPDQVKGYACALAKEPIGYRYFLFVTYPDTYAASTGVTRNPRECERWLKSLAKEIKRGKKTPSLPQPQLAPSDTEDPGRHKGLEQFIAAQNRAAHLLAQAVWSYDPRRGD